MTAIAATSSTIANASRKMRSRFGQRGPTSASTPSAKAVSVEMAIPQPTAPSPPPTTARYTAAGTISPPRAAMAGAMTARRSWYSPIDSSRAISRMLRLTLAPVGTD